MRLTHRHPPGTYRPRPNPKGRVRRTLKRSADQAWRRDYRRGEL